jgi:hypothetical protein
MDNFFYTIVSFGAASFLFLGGIQLHFKWTLLAMIVTYTISSVGETVGILLAFKNTPSLQTLVVTSDVMASRMRSIKAELNPSSVYEDLGRGKEIVVMVFITQVILISFVVSFVGLCRGYRACMVKVTKIISSKWSIVHRRILQ